MSDTFRLTLAQLDATTGDLSGNAAKARTAWEVARDAGADMVALPEMFLTGHTPRGLSRRPGVVAEARRHLDDLIAACADGPALGIGAPTRPGDAEKPRNTWIVAHRGRIVAEVHKHHGSRDAAFETRSLAAGDVSGPYAIGPVRIGSLIGADAWSEDVAETLAETGAEILIVPTGSPYSRGGQDVRYGHMVARVVETGLPLVWLNLTGGQDDLVFDGASFALNPGGALTHHLPSFEDTIVHVDFDRTADGWRARPGIRVPQPEGPEADYRAMVRGLRDHMGKSGATTALLGLSGDTASALVAAIAADAIGPANLRCVTLHSDDTARENARGLAKRLGCRLDILPIDASHTAVTKTVAQLSDAPLTDIAGANLRSRLRGLLLASLAETFGAMLLTPATRSELAIGGVTILGDATMGYDPVKGLYRSALPDLCRWRNAHSVEGFLGPAREVVPTHFIDTPPATEPGADLTGLAQLPPYPALDDILERLIDREQSVEEIALAGHDRDAVKRVEHRVDAIASTPIRSPGLCLSGRTARLDRHDPSVEA
ncbi:NAD(+) synthase [uncultured Jannaschia sp.]|uniref:NAD(+) synthase n=1 Tax=uncultured Jannaschia sp. TaxID=293347 RepID=UPI002601653A|nr:NAD(+) synthase [uncultured Jannaschia sp.]